MQVIFSKIELGSPPFLTVIQFYSNIDETQVGKRPQEISTWPTFRYILTNFKGTCGYRKSGEGPCIYIKSVRCRDGKINFVMLALYVNDILWFSNSAETLKKEKKALAKRLKVDDMGEVSYVLGMLVKRNSDAKNTYY